MNHSSKKTQMSYREWKLMSSQDAANSQQEELGSSRATSPQISNQTQHRSNPSNPRKGFNACVVDLPLIY